MRLPPSCRNCLDQIRATGAIDFDNLTGFINDPGDRRRAGEREVLTAREGGGADPAVRASSLCMARTTARL